MTNQDRTAILAIDIGASCGRHIVRLFGDQGPEDVEVYRFENRMDVYDGHLVWNVERIWNSIKAGIVEACRRYSNIRSVGIDTWGVDYVLMKGNKAMHPVFAYRDHRTLPACREVNALISDTDLYARTGCQFQPFNTIYQMWTDKQSGRLDAATDFMMLPEYFFWKLTGVMLHEYTNATTTGLVDAVKKAYDPALLSILGFPSSLFGELSYPGYSRPLMPKLREELGLKGEAVLVATHDTASAVEGIDMPLKTLYVSSGTWSLLGVKLESPIINEGARMHNFTNEGGIGYFRFQKNIMGLWIIQRLKEELDIPSFDMVIRLAESSRYQGVFDANSPSLLAPESMKDQVLGALMEVGQARPESDADLLNSVFFSLAESYRNTIDEIERLTGFGFKDIHIFGGGARNGYLNRLIELVTGKRVAAYPLEATALGNLKIQQMKLQLKKD
jgi:rhamnulokinase